MRTLVVSANLVDAVTSRLRGLLQAKVDAQGPATVDFTDVGTRLAQVQAQVIVVVLAPDPDVGLDVIGSVRRQTTGYILAVGPADPRLILQALREGADHYLDEAELETGIDAAVSRWQGRGEVTAPSGRLIAVLAASGGSGASTLAVNVAAALARGQERCALIDLKPGRGDLAALLDLKPAFHLADLCLNVARLDRAMFEKMLVRHEGGVHLLAAPQVFGDTRLVTPHGVSQSLALARKLFQVVVADLEDCFHEEQVSTLQQASVVLLVARLDFTSLRNARRILDHLDGLNVSRNLVRLAVNRYGQPGELPPRDAEEALGGKIDYYIPDDSKAVNTATNTGVPVVLKTPGSRVAQAVCQLAEDLLERRRTRVSPLSKLLAR